ncbi:LysR family transcriptional regulator [Agrobacterium rubi]|uniref:LysR family transcriptional regulator n=1 Tax=Agrobacterium rubi TaxID=28099 RepID=UPI0015740816|nr:LysR substrate-binding domain-containing protein [Agrobacterium rubi]NTF10575.1 LysR family transcriptional regulator [Agrobacterium rubi]NTF22969.1 LysR family transcriptional regulator [Agrobacterium rubi]NTF29900.1 LysR family transcriptional regulator [Agrobacterium rubi]
MDISQLQTIIQIAETGSISKASERLNVVQPALSRKLGNLEQELGAALFERHGRGMLPTDIGRAAVQHALAIMAELDCIRQLANTQNGPLQGEVIVGITPTIAEIVTVPLAQRAKLVHPNLSIRFASAFSGYLLDWLQRGELDVALSYETLEAPSVQTRPVMVEDLLLIGPAAKFAPNGPAVQFADLAHERLILPGVRHGLRKILDECAAQAGINLSPAIEVDSLSAMVALIRADFGYTILPLPPVHELVESGLLSFARIIDPKPKRTVVIAFSSLRAVSPAARFVADSFLEIARELVAKETWAGELLPDRKP